MTPDQARDEIRRRYPTADQIHVGEESDEGKTVCVAYVAYECEEFVGTGPTWQSAIEAVVAAEVAS